MDRARARAGPTVRSKPARFDPDPGPLLRRWGLRALALESGATEAIGILINQSPGCRQGMSLAPKLAAWLLPPVSGAFGLETFWLGSATSESLRDSDYNSAATEVALAASEPNEAGRNVSTGPRPCKWDDTGRRVERAVRRG